LLALKVMNKKLKGLSKLNFGSQYNFSRRLKKTPSYVSEVIRRHWNIAKKDNPRWPKLLQYGPCEIIGGPGD